MDCPDLRAQVLKAFYIPGHGLSIKERREGEKGRKWKRGKGRGGRREAAAILPPILHVSLITLPLSTDN
jgi:hypothetical protein